MKNKRPDIDPKYEFMSFMNSRSIELPARHKKPEIDVGALIKCRELARRCAVKELSDPFVYKRQLSRFMSGADDYRTFQV